MVTQEISSEINYEQMAPQVVAALRRAFPENATIVTSQGYQGRVQVKLISDKLNGKGEQEKQAYLWDILHRELGANAQAVSFILGYGTDEL